MLIEQAAQGSRNTSCLFLYSRAPQEKTPGGKQTDAPRTAGVRSGTREATWTLSRPPRPVERERERDRETERQSVMKDRVRQAGKQTDRQMDRYREAHAGIYRYTHTYIFVYNTYIYAHIKYIHACKHTYICAHTHRQTDISRYGATLF